MEIVQNPALGAQVIRAAVSSHFVAKGEGLRLDLCFLILPLVFWIETQSVINGTKPSSGLAKFVFKLEGKRDILLALHSRALEQRELTLESIATGITSKLLAIDYERPLVRHEPVRKRLPAPDEVKPLLQAADRLGTWFAQLSPDEVMTILRIRA